MELHDYEYELGGLPIGRDTRRLTFAENVEIGAPQWVDQDQQNPVGDNVRFGRDHLGGATWTFLLVVDADSELEARQELDRLTAAWRPRQLAKTPGAVVPLRYRLGGKDWCVYGRPRNFALDDWSGLEQGVVTASGQFVTTDAKTYEADEQQITVTLIPMVAGGLSGSLSGNLTSLASGQRAGLVTVGGGVETHLKVTFQGPVTDPKVRSEGWEIGLNGNLAYDQSVTVNTRDNTITRSDGASVAGMLSRRSYLEDARLQPGPQEVIFEGTSSTGTATATVAWQVAHESSLGS